MEVKHSQPCEDQGLSDLITVLKAKQRTGFHHQFLKLLLLSPEHPNQIFFPAVLAEESIDERAYMLLKLSDLTVPAVAESASRNVSIPWPLVKESLHIFPDIRCGLVWWHLYGEECLI